jgi:glycosyltransferase involved in cell wall biosynthesis
LSVIARIRSAGASDPDFSSGIGRREKPSVDPDSPVMIKPMIQVPGPVRIAHLIATNFFGGPEKQIVEHLKRLDSSKYFGILLSFLEDGQENEILIRARDAGIEGQGIPSSGPLDLTAWYRLKAVIQIRAINLLCVHGYKSTVMGLWIHKKLGVPTLAFSRGYTAENKKVAFYQYLDRLALRHVNGVVCVSDGQRRRLVQLGVHAERMWVVHNAIQTPDAIADAADIRSRVIKQFGLRDDSILCVTAGRLSPEKGHKDLIRAISLMGKRAAKCCFLICGDGPCRAPLEEQVHALNLDDQIRFAGFRRDIQDIFQAMDMLILPSHSEGLPNVVLEAFSYGKAVVATSVGGVPELVEDGKNGILVPSENPKALADAIVQFMEDPVRRESLGEAARSATRLRFNFDDQTQKLEAIYTDILAS